MNFKNKFGHLIGSFRIKLSIFMHGTFFIEASGKIIKSKSEYFLFDYFFKLNILV